MELMPDKKVLISGASIAGLATAYWMNALGYKVTVVEIAEEIRTNGAAVDIRGNAVAIAKRMGIFEQLKSNRLTVEVIEFKNAEDGTEGSIVLQNDDVQSADDIEIEKDLLLSMILATLENNIEFIFNNSITDLKETKEEIKVSFKNGLERSFDLVVGCDGIHSAVRKIWFGNKPEYTYFLNAYFSISTVEKLLIRNKTMQMFNVPDKAVTLNAYKNKTDIIFCFYSEEEISYHYRDTEHQQQMVLEQFEGIGWRTSELLKEVQDSKRFYFDKFCQIKMPSWTKGRVALVGDAGYCASPAAGMGASLSIEGAAALADALQRNNGDFTLAFEDYNKNLRPFIEEVQATAELNIKENFLPRSDEAIHKRNTQAVSF